MQERKFIVEGEIVKIPESKIKNYYAYPECFVKEGHELYVFNEKIFVSEDGDYCAENNCSLPEPQNMYDKDGKPLCHCAEDFVMDSVPGFIHEDRLYFVNFLQEIPTS